MTLKLRFLARARLWSEVVVTGGDRVFVATTETPPPGTQLEIEVETPELEAPLFINVTVLEVRPLSPGLPAGIFVKVDAPSLERCRAVVADHDESARTTGRTEARVDCDLPSRLVSPLEMHGCATKSLSASGLTLLTPQPLVGGEQVKLAVQLPLSGELLVSGTVLWTRTELSLAGIKLSDGDTAMSARLQEAIDEVSSNRPRSALLSRTVLVADDDPSILDFTSRVVTKAGHKVLRAERGDTALELVRTNRPNLVFLDVLMPGLDGLEVCRAIRADAALAKTPVILLSAMGEERLVEAMKLCGADGYLTKPMRLEAVRAVLAERLASS